MGVYLVFIHKGNEKMQYGGYFSTRKKAEEVCEKYNSIHTYDNDSSYADFINVTDEVDDTYLID